jgi:glycosyltransferase involved in cell wall biosynthesis
MRTTFDIAIIIPVYNRAAVVLDTLDSVVRQTMGARQLIIVDDGSTDDTVKAVRQWVARHDLPGTLISVIRQDKLGASAARNRGIEAAQACEYFAFLDSDDCWPNDFLQRMAAAFHQNPTAIAATTDRLFYRGKAKRDRLCRSTAIAKGATKWLLLRDSGIGSCTVFAAQPIRALGGYDVDIPSGHDTKLFLPLSARGQWLYVSGNPVKFTVALTTETDQAPNLSRSHPNREFIRAMLRQDFLFTESGTEHVSRQTIRRCLMRRWYKAGREALQSGNVLASREFFSKAIRWNPLHCRAHCGLLRTWFHGVAVSP